MANIRSFLFVPASRADRFEKALESAADAVVIDLEDAVSIDGKGVARDTLCDWLEEQEKEDERLLKRIWVRINPLHSPWGHDDMDELSEFQLGGWILPQAESTYDVEQVINLKPKRTELALLVETAIGIAHTRLLAAIPGVGRLMLGSIDLQLDLNMKCDALETQLNFYRSELVLASRLGGLEAPVDGVTTSTTDIELLTQSVQQARAYGFGAKLCIHPRQVDTVNQGFTPSAQEYEWAQKVVAGHKQHKGEAFAVEGKMVDAPVVTLAEQIIEQFQKTRD